MRSNSNTPTNRSEQTAETIIYSTTPSAPITNRTQPYSSLASITTSINTGASSQIIYSVLNAGTIDPKKSEQIEPVYEMGTSETTNSLSWNPHSEHSLLAGMNGKSLKIYDIRGKILKLSNSTFSWDKDNIFFLKRILKIFFFKYCSYHEGLPEHKHKICE